MSVDVSVL